MRHRLCKATSLFVGNSLKELNGRVTAVISPLQCAGLNRYEAGEEESLRERIRRVAHPTTLNTLTTEAGAGAPSELRLLGWGFSLLGGRSRSSQARGDRSGYGDLISWGRKRQQQTRNLQFVTFIAAPTSEPFAPIAAMGRYRREPLLASSLAVALEETRRAAGEAGRQSYYIWHWRRKAPPEQTKLGWGTLSGHR